MQAKITSVYCPVCRFQFFPADSPVCTKCMNYYKKPINMRVRNITPPPVMFACVSRGHGYIFK